MNPITPAELEPLTAALAALTGQGIPQDAAAVLVMAAVLARTIPAPPPFPALAWVPPGQEKKEESAAEETAAAPESEPAADQPIEEEDHTTGKPDKAANP